MKFFALLVDTKMKTHKFIFVLLSTISFSGLNESSFAQDTSLINTVEKETRRIYDNSDKQYWFLTKEKVIALGDTIGTEITAYSFKDTINRIVCIGYDREGQWAVEFYISNDKLIFVYYSKSFFDNDTTKSSFFNWKKYPTVEIRIYYNNNSIIYYSSNGIKNEKEVLRTGNMFLLEVDKLAYWINKHIKK